MFLPQAWPLVQRHRSEPIDLDDPAAHFPDIFPPNLPQRIQASEIPDISNRVIGVMPAEHKSVGGFAFVRRGRLNYGSSVEGKSMVMDIAIKTLKVSYYREGNMWNKKRFRAEVQVWKRLSHKNILRFLGTAYLPFHGLPLSLVSPWMRNGNVITYLGNRSEIPRLPLLEGIIAGIEYLHSEGVIHGDIKGNNILISDEGVPLLCDFGLACFEDETERDASSTVRRAGAKQWMAIELLMSNCPGVSVTKASDMWAFGMVVVELLTGEIPFPGMNDVMVILSVHRRALPPRPLSGECCDALWELVQQCWMEDPDERPKATEALAMLAFFLYLPHDLALLDLPMAAPSDPSDANVGTNNSSSSSDNSLLMMRADAQRPLTMAIHKLVHIEQKNVVAADTSQQHPSTNGLTSDLLLLGELFNKLEPSLNESQEEVGEEVALVVEMNIVEDDGLHNRLNLTGLITRVGQREVGHEIFSDVWEGRLNLQGITDAEDKKVAVKAIKVTKTAGLLNDMPNKKLVDEVCAWSKLDHPNVLVPLGFTYSFVATESSLASLVFPWMPEGTATQYLKECDTSERIRALIGIADGLCYLHENEIVHGDIKGDNILIDEHLEPRLAYFGLSELLTGVSDMKTVTDTAGLPGSTRWMAPELLCDGSSGVTCESDIWALGMTIVEMFTNLPPFYYLKEETEVIVQVLEGALPKRPDQCTGINDDLWNLCNDCWEMDPELRPAARGLAKRLSDLGLLIYPPKRRSQELASLEHSSRTVTIHKSEPDI